MARFAAVAFELVLSSVLLLSELFADICEEALLLLRGDVISAAACEEALLFLHGEVLLLLL